MGQQQLLLIVLGVIVVGIAVAVGLTMFVDNAQSTNRDAVTIDLVNLASNAMLYYRRPVEMGGGGNSFTGLTMKNLSSRADGSGTLKNSNGLYVIVGTPSGAGPVSFKGTGTELGKDGSNKIVVVIQVWPDSAKVNLSDACAN